MSPERSAKIFPCCPTPSGQAIVIALTLLAFRVLPADGQTDFAQYANPLAGVKSVANTNPGPNTPFGMVSGAPGKPGLEWPSQSGSWSVDTFFWFDHFHHSGTGTIGNWYGFFRVAPMQGTLDYRRVYSNKSQYQYPRQTNVHAAPGVYEADLTPDGIHAAMTVTPHCSFHEFTFTQGSPHVLVCLSDGENWQNFTFDLTRIDERSFQGTMHTHGDIFFYAQSDMDIAASDQWEEQSHGGFYLTGSADTRTARLKVGFSLLSVDKAKANLQREIPGWSFDSTAAQTRQRWNDFLGRIQVESDTEQHLRTFYTALYHSLLKPVDCTGEYADATWDADAPCFFDMATMWDVYRSQMPMIMTLYPDIGVPFVNFLIRNLEWNGFRDGNATFLGHLNNQYFLDQGCGLVQQVIAHALALGYTGIDWDRAQNALVRSLDTLVARGCLPGKGPSVTPNDYPRPPEGMYFAGPAYCAAAWCAAQVCRHNADIENFERMSTEASGWQSFYSATSKSIYNDPGSFFYEGNQWTYAFDNRHDYAGYIQFAGGDNAVLDILDNRGGYFNPWTLYNENTMHVFYLYHYIGRPDRTAERIHEQFFRFDDRISNCVPGNDDSGGLSSWFVLNSIGLWPVVGQDVILIGSPLFPHTTVQVPTGASFVIDAPNVSEANIYVAGATLNGSALDRAYLYWHEMRNGGRLVLTMQATPSSWATQSRPPASFLSDSSFTVKTPGIEKLDRSSMTPSSGRTVEVFALNGKRLGSGARPYFRTPLATGYRNAPNAVVVQRVVDALGNEQILKRAFLK